MPSLATSTRPLLQPHVHAARTVLDPAHVRRALRITPADSTFAAAVRCGGAVALALAVTAAAGRADLAGYAALAALASLYGRWEPYRRRGALLALVGACLVTAIGLASLVAALGAPGVVAAALAALVAAGVHALLAAVRAGAPGATIVVFGVGAGMAGSPDLHDAAARTLAAVVGAGVAWLVCCSGAVLHPAGPARIAVRRAARAVERAVAAGVSAPPTREADELRRHAVELLDRARDVLADDASRARSRAATADLVVLLADLDRSLGRVPEPLPPRRTLRSTARGSVLARSDVVRVLVAGLAAGGLAHAAGSAHSPWAVMGSTATLQGATPGHAVTRGLQRAAGTTLGAFVAWPLLAADLPLWAAGALVVVLQVVTEVLVLRHYGVTMLTITPMALLMTSLGTHGDPTALALDRVVDTALGAAVAVLALVVLPHRSARTTRV